MLSKPPDCIGCSLYEKGIGFSNPEGTGRNGIMMLGEALGEHESRDGLPFRPYAQAGSQLERSIRSLRLDRQDFVLWNTVACRPPRDWLEGSPWEYSAVRHCQVHRDRVIAKYKPKVIVTLGGVAYKALMGHGGEKDGVSYMRGYVLPLTRPVPTPCPDCAAINAGIVDPHCFLCGGAGTIEDGKENTGVYVVPTYHPSFIRRGASWAIPVTAFDLKLALRVARDGFQQHPVEYQLKPSPDEAESFYLKVKDSPGALVTYDIETPTSADLPEDERDDDPSYEITQIQFSTAPYTGICFPWRSPYKEIAAKILALGNTKANHNTWSYDDPRLRHNGVTLNGLIHDTMWIWHHLQPDMPAHLQYAASFYGMDFPWKHLSHSDPELYGCADVDAPQRIMSRALQDLKDRGIEAGYMRHILALQPILVGASKRGVPIDNVQRENLRDVLTQLQDAKERDIQAVVPAEILNLQPKQGYVRQPKDTTGMVQRTFSVIEKVRAGGELDAELKEVVAPKLIEVERWVKLIPFNPGSWQQVLRYMKAKKHPVPKSRKEVDAQGNAKETTAKKELERLSRKTGDKFYLDIIAYREFEKMRGTYVEGFKPAADGCVHTTFTFETGTGQLTSRNPNVQNIPTHEQDKPDRPNLAKAFRRMIDAGDDYELVEFDYKSFHALTLGFLARDLDYMRMARLDFHSYVTAHMTKQPDRETMIQLSDADLMQRLKEIRKQHEYIRDFKAKRAQLGYGFGMRYRTLYAMWPENFDSEREAKYVMDLLDALFPRAAAWREEIRKQAHEQQRLVSPWGFHRWFFDVYHYDPKRGKMVSGEDSEKAIAFLPANLAFGHIKEAMLRLDQRGVLARGGFINNIHDSLLFRMLRALKAELIPLIYTEMSQPSTVLIDPVSAPLGLSVGVSVKVGQNWCKKSDSNPNGMYDLDNVVQLDTLPPMPEPPEPMVAQVSA
jgi:uracil-DNA glycosylase family 4